MAKNFDYRKFYKEYYGIDFGSGYDIHHIDFDRNNNDIENLIVLPHSLHSNYHICLQRIRGCESCLDSLYMYSYLIPEIRKYIDITSEMLEWWGFKRDFDIFFESGVKNIKETIPEYRLPYGVNWKTNKED